MECDGFGVAVVVHPDDESCPSKTAPNFEIFPNDSSQGHEKDYHSDAKSVALHSRSQASSSTSLLFRSNSQNRLQTLCLLIFSFFSEPSHPRVLWAINLRIDG